VSHVIVYNVQLRSSGTRARALNFRVKHGTKFWFAGSAFSAPSQYRNWRILISLDLKLRSTQKNENTRSHQNRSNCIVFFSALHERLRSPVTKLPSDCSSALAPLLLPPPHSPWKRVDCLSSASNNNRMIPMLVSECANACACVSVRVKLTFQSSLPNGSQ
jgi:hypothetical protein